MASSSGYSAADLGRAFQAVRIAVRKDEHLAGAEAGGFGARHHHPAGSFQHHVVGNDHVRPRQDDASEGAGRGNVDAPRSGGPDPEEERAGQSNTLEDV